LKGISMKIVIKMASLCVLVFLASGTALGQRRTNKRPESKSVATAQRTFCKGESVQGGFVVVGYKSSAKCGVNAELIVKKPADTEIVCDGSPIPDGFHVVSQEGSPACAGASPNPLTNALTITRQDSASTTRPSSKVASRSFDEEEEEETPRRESSQRATRSTNNATSIIQQRADEANADALRGLAESARLNAINTAIRNRRVIVGMTSTQVLRAVGRPDSVKRDTTRDGVYDIWIYNTGRYSYGAVHLQDGIVVLVGART
jgi:hypothetical protein